MPSATAEKVRLPAVANKRVEVVESPSLSPTGIASFISSRGVIAVKNTVNSGGIFTFYINTLFLAFNGGGVKLKIVSAKKLCNRPKIGKV